MFGWGWGMKDTEARLQLLGDGFIVVTEWGGGKEVRLRPVDQRLSIEEAVKDIVAAGLRSADPRASDPAFRERLQQDGAFRQGEWQRLVGKALRAPDPPRAGARFETEGGTSAELVVEAAGYRYENRGSGLRIWFDGEERPQRVEGTGRLVNLKWSSAARSVRLEDRSGHHITLTLNDRGLVEQVEQDGRKAFYRYKNDELVSSLDLDANRYEYEYSKNGKHDLTTIKYADGSTMEMTYDPNAPGKLRSLQSRNGTVTMFDYGEPSEVGPITVRRIGLTVTEGKNRFTGYLELHERRDLAGVPFTEKTITEINGDKIERQFDRRARMASEVNRNGSVTRYKYDKDSRPTQRESPDSTLFIEYAVTQSRVARLQHHQEGAAGRATSAWRFEYDKEGLLASASSAELDSFKAAAASDG